MSVSGWGSYEYVRDLLMCVYVLKIGFMCGKGLYLWNVDGFID